MSKYPIVMLNSGGYDSTILLHWLREINPKADIHCLFFNYGQKNSIREGICSQENSYKLGCSFSRIALPPITWTKGDFYSGEYSEDESYTQYVEYRNLIFLSYAASYAQSIGAREIYVAFLTPSVGYVDTSKSFVKSFNSVLKPSKIKVIAPFIEYTKYNLAGLAFKYNITEKDFFSCNVPIHGHSCGQCGDCIAIKECMEEASINSIQKAMFKTQDPHDKVFVNQYMNADVYEAYLLINNSCQLRCEHCFYGFDDMVSKPLSKKEYFKVIQQLIDMGISNFHFSGKEPLFDGDIFEYATYIKEHSNCTFDVVTNGVNVPKYAVDLKSLGFTRIFLSVDDIIYDNDLRSNKWAIAALKAIKEHGLYCEVSIDLHKHNYDHVRKIVETLYKDYDINTFYIRNLLHISGAQSIDPLTIDEINEAYISLLQLCTDNKNIFIDFSLGMTNTYACKEREDILLGEDVNYQIFTGNQYVMENFRLLIEVCCQRYGYQITVTPDGYVLGCATEVAHKNYDKIAIGNVRDKNMIDLVTEGKKLGILVNQKCFDNQSFCNGCTHFS